MGIFSSLVSLFKGRDVPSVNQQVATVPKETVCMIFLDYRNLQPQWNEATYAGVRWDLVRKETARISQGSNIFHQAVYRSPEGSDSSKDKDVQEVWNKHGYTFEAHTKDIDSWISSDLWEKCLEATDNPAVSGLRIILGSGDVDFLRPLKRIKNRWGASHTITVVLVCWTYKVHHELLAFADEVHFLDKIPNLVRHASRHRKTSVASN